MYLVPVTSSLVKILATSLLGSPASFLPPTSSGCPPAPPRSHNTKPGSRNCQESIAALPHTIPKPSIPAVYVTSGRASTRVELLAGFVCLPSPCTSLSLSREPNSFRASGRIAPSCRPPTSLPRRRTRRRPRLLPLMLLRRHLPQQRRRTRRKLSLATRTKIPPKVTPTTGALASYQLPACLICFSSRLLQHHFDPPDPSCTPSLHVPVTSAYLDARYANLVRSLQVTMQLLLRSRPRQLNPKPNPRSLPRQLSPRGLRRRTNLQTSR